MVLSANKIYFIFEETLQLWFGVKTSKYIQNIRSRVDFKTFLHKKLKQFTNSPNHAMFGKCNKIFDHRLVEEN